jgi:hypothetical protein
MSSWELTWRKRMSELTFQWNVMQTNKCLSKGGMSDDTDFTEHCGGVLLVPLRETLVEKATAQAV